VVLASDARQPAEHHHVLLLAPFTYSTYRGSWTRNAGGASWAVPRATRTGSPSVVALLGMPSSC
jgi:hypothetical protein